MRNRQSKPKEQKWDFKRAKTGERRLDGYTEKLFFLKPIWKRSRKINCLRSVLTDTQMLIPFKQCNYILFFERVDVAKPILTLGFICCGVIKFIKDSSLKWVSYFLPPSLIWALVYSDVSIHRRSMHSGVNYSRDWLSGPRFKRRML